MGFLRRCLPGCRPPSHRLPHRLSPLSLLAVLLVGGLMAAVPAALLAAQGEVHLRTLVSRDAQGRAQTEWHVKVTPEGKLVRHGQFVRWHANGKPALVGYYRDGHPVGVWRWYDEHGGLLRSAVQEGDTEEVLKGRDLPQDETVFRSPKGLRIAEGLFKYDKAHGHWMYYYGDGAPRAEGRFLVGIPDGRWTFYYDSGQIQRVEEYRLGVPDGLYLQGYPNGQERIEGRMDQGLRVGPWRTWYANGQVESEGRYAEDRREGEWRFWSEEGRLLRRVRYHEGKVAEELPLPTAHEKLAQIIPHPERLPFRPRLYRESGTEIKPKAGY